MKHLRLALSALILVFALPASANEPAPATDANLPTPYTAEQIRDAWVEGLRVVTRYTTPEGATTSVTRVVEWSAEGMVLTDQPVDAEGALAGEARRVESTWAELRDHASFPAAASSRERDERETPLGKAEGWVYRVRGGNGVQAEFFFADDWPGPPVVFSQSRGGQRLLLVEMIERDVVKD